MFAEENWVEALSSIILLSMTAGLLTLFFVFLEILSACSGRVDRRLEKIIADIKRRLGNQ